MLNQEKGNLKMIRKLSASVLALATSGSVTVLNVVAHIYGGGTCSQRGRADFIHELFCMSAPTCLGLPKARCHLMQNLLRVGKQHALLQSIVRLTNDLQSPGIKDQS